MGLFKLEAECDRFNCFVGDLGGGGGKGGGGEEGGGKGKEKLLGRGFLREDIAIVHTELCCCFYNHC